MAPYKWDGPGGGHEEIRELDDSELGAAHARGRVPPWREQLTARGMVASLAVGAMYSVIVMKLVLTTGLVPTLSVSAALIAFVVLRGWTKALARLGFAARPFTRQENTVVQTCAVACYSIAVGGQGGHNHIILPFVKWSPWTDASLDSCAPQVGSGPTCLRSTRRPTRCPGRRRRATCLGATRSPALRG
jgi:hypothetical protein